MAQTAINQTLNSIYRQKVAKRRIEPHSDFIDLNSVQQNIVGLRSLCCNDKHAAVIGHTCEFRRGHHLRACDFFRLCKCGGIEFIHITGEQKKRGQNAQRTER